MTKEEVVNKLSELKALNIPKMSVHDLETLLNRRSISLNNDQKNAVNDYMSKFAKIDNPHKCLFCGSTNYSWGILHGSAYCNNCGWEFRIYHYIEDEQKNSIVGGRIKSVFQYHPDCYFIKNDETESES